MVWFVFCPSLFCPELSDYPGNKTPDLPHIMTDLGWHLVGGLVLHFSIPLCASMTPPGSQKSPKAIGLSKAGESHLSCNTIFYPSSFLFHKDVTADFIGVLGGDYPASQTPSLQTDFVWTGTKLVQECSETWFIHWMVTDCAPTESIIREISTAHSVVTTILTKPA